jgi:tRNA (guanine26-N2/guanine27-N2)-dimethyltransferase
MRGRCKQTVTVLHKLLHLNLASCSTVVPRFMANPGQISVPEGFTLHSENNSHILLPSSNEAFLNPVQEFNRDTSVACIRVWSEELNRAKEAKWRLAQERSANKTGSDRKRFKGG